MCSSLLASVLVRAGEARDVDEAATLLGRALTLHDRVGDRRGTAQSLEVLAEVALARGAAATAGRLAGAAAVCRDQVDATPTEVESRGWPTSTPGCDRIAGSCRRRPRPARRQDHAGRGGARAGGRVTAVGTAGEGAVELTARQLEVAALVAAGRTNRQIGKALGISEKTTEIHVHNLMSRLDVPSRAGVAAWAAARGLDPDPPPPVGDSPYGHLRPLLVDIGQAATPRPGTGPTGPWRDRTWTRTS